MAKFSIEYRISGTMTDIIEASSKDEAEKIANANAENEGWEPDLHSVDSVDFHIQEMHRVVRAGKAVWTTYVRPDDVPEPVTPSQA